MRSYRFYRLDGAGKIAAADWIQAGDDSEACGHAQQRADGASYELWERDRLIAREPQPPR